MSKIRLHGSSSGYTEIAPVAASGNNTLTLPNDGTIISKDSNGAVGVTSVVTTTATITTAKVGAAVTISESGIEASGIGITCASINGTQIGGRRNLIINGAMQVAQRGDVSSVQTDYGGCDRFRVEGNTAARFTLNQTTGTTANGFPYCQEVDVTTASGSLAASAYHYLGYKLEGQDLQLLKKGTANAESVTLSFWVSSPKTGTHNIQLYDTDNARHTTKQYTIGTANTFEHHTITFSGDTTGAFDNDSAYSLQIYWWLAAGTNYTSGSSTDWQAFSNSDAAPGQVNLLDSTDNNFKLTGVQLEIGTQATTFENRSYGEELALCQRYFYKPDLNNFLQPAYQYYYNAKMSVVEFPTTMRATPTCTATWNTSGTFTQYNLSTSHFKAYVASAYDANESFYLTAFQASSEI